MLAYTTRTSTTHSSISTIIPSTKPRAIASSSQYYPAIKTTTSTESTVELHLNTTSKMTTDDITGKITVSITTLKMTTFTTSPIFSLTSSQQSTIYTKPSTQIATTLKVESTSTITTVTHNRTQHTTVSPPFITMQTKSTEGK